MIWETLDSDARLRRLPRVVKEVVYDPRSSTLTVELDEGQIGNVTDAIIEADLEEIGRSEGAAEATC